MIGFDASWFIEFGFYFKPLLYLRSDLPRDVRTRLLTYARIGLTLLTTDSRFTGLLPQSIETATDLMEQIDIWTGLKKDHFGPRTEADLPSLHDLVKSLSTTLTNELRTWHVYCVTEKSGLDVDTLVVGYSKTYSSEALALFDAFVTREIDEAGRCLAFVLPTAAGFHILRAVEIMLKAYVYTITGSFPALNRRNWGEYIDRLEKAAAPKSITDPLHIIKHQRNPLMHPQDVLEMDTAVNVFSLCRSGITGLTSDIRRRSLSTQFIAALALVPTL